MVEGHIFYPVHLCVCICVSQNRVRPIALSCMVRFENNLVQMIVMTRQCVVNKIMLLRQRSRSQLALKLCS